jgi:8-oxo-dGTP pyrophosphatase MutT (NUDIX family)
VPASTVLLVRDRTDGLEVLMVVRHDEVDFAAGAAVFPGGKLDAGDRDPALKDRVRTADGLDELQVALRIGAIREIFEECGMLMAYPRGSDQFVDAARLGNLLDAYRTPLEAGDLTMGEFAVKEDLEFSCDDLVNFAHWITPAVRKKRFDTYFFVAATPENQIAVHDGREAVDSVWITPGQALDDYKAGLRTIIFPTRLNLRKLGRSSTTAEALAAARASRIVTVLPEVANTPNGRVIRIPKEADYGVHEVDFDTIANENRMKG